MCSPSCPMCISLFTALSLSIYIYISNKPETATCMHTTDQVSYNICYQGTPGHRLCPEIMQAAQSLAGNKEVLVQGGGQVASQGPCHAICRSQCPHKAHTISSDEISAPKHFVESILKVCRCL